MTSHRSETTTYVAVFIALLVLLVLTVEVAMHDLGHWGFPLTALIALTKGFLIVTFFMRIRESFAVTKLVLAAGLVGLGILFSLALADYFTRA